MGERTNGAGRGNDSDRTEAAGYRSGNGQNGGNYYGNGQNSGNYYGNGQNGGNYYGSGQTGEKYYGNGQYGGGNYYGSNQTDGNYYGSGQNGANYYGSGPNSGGNYYGNGQNGSGNYYGSSQNGNGNYYGGSQNGNGNYYGGSQNGNGNYYGSSQSGGINYYGSSQNGGGNYYGSSQNGNGNYYGSSQNGGSYYGNGQRNGGNYYGGNGMNSDGRRKTTVGDVLRIILMIVALGVFLYSAWMLYGFYKEYKKGSDEYDNLESSYAVNVGEEESEDLDALEDDEKVEEMKQPQSISGREVATVMENGTETTLPTMRNPINFEELIAVNDDIVGWLRVRALDISYPVVQAEDNDYYLHRTFERTDNFAGCLFMNCSNNRDLTDKNTIIYGHNMKNGSMFGKLKNFSDEETFNKSKYFWIFTPDIIYQYRIFSARVVSTVGESYQTSFTDEEYQQFIYHAFENSVVENANVEVTTADRVVTLSTCTGDTSTRFVVVGKLAQMYASK